MPDAPPTSGSGDAPPVTAAASFTRGELADHVGIPETIVEVLEREGLLAARHSPDGALFSEQDAAALSAGVALLDAGVPLDELLDLARRWDDHARVLAGEAVELFLRFVRDPIHGSAASGQEADERLRTAFRDMFPAAGHIVAHHFRSLLLQGAAARIRSDGDAQELAALAGVAPDRAGASEGSDDVMPDAPPPPAAQMTVGGSAVAADRRT